MCQCAIGQSLRFGDSSLYLFTKDGKYGVCLRSKQVLIPATYFYVDFDGPFCIARNDNKVYDIWSTTGRKLASGLHITKLNDTALVAFSQSKSAGYDRDEYSANPGNVFVSDTNTRASGCLVYPSGIAYTLPGIVIRYADGRCIVDSSGYQGVIDVLSGKRLMPLRYKNVKEMFGLYLGWNDSSDYSFIDKNGKAHKAPPTVGSMTAITTDGFFFIKGIGGSNTSYFNGDGKLLYKGAGTYHPDSHLPDIPSVAISTDRGPAYLDTLGNLIPKPENKEPLRIDGCGDIIITENRVPDSLRYKAHRWNDGIYNTKTKKYILTAPDDTSVRIWKGQALIYSLSKGMLRAYDGYGNVIVEMQDKLVHTYEDTNYVRYYYRTVAVRSNLNERFTVYNVDLTRRCGLQFDNLAPGNCNWEFLGKVKGKWGVYRYRSSERTISFDENAKDTLSEIVPPIYDAIERNYQANLYQITANGKKFWLDNTGKVIAGGKPLTDLGSAVANKHLTYIQSKTSDGHWLIVQINMEEPYQRFYEKITMVDSGGKVINTLAPPGPARVWRCYAYSGDRVLCFTTAGHGIIWHAQGGKITKLNAAPPEGMSNDPGISTEKGLIAIIVENDAHQQGVYSLLEEKMIVPFGKYDQLRSILYNKTSVAFTTNPYIDRRVLVIYDENGTLY